MKPLIKIHPAIKKDIPQIVTFQQNLSKETENELLNLAIVTAGVTAVFDDPAKGIYYVAKIDNEVVGCLLTTFEWSDWSNKNVLWIASLYVEKKWRGKVIFKTFYSYLKDLVNKSDEYKALRL